MGHLSEVVEEAPPPEDSQAQGFPSVGDFFGTEPAADGTEPAADGTEPAADGESDQGDAEAKAQAPSVRAKATPPAEHVPEKPAKHVAELDALRAENARLRALAAPEKPAEQAKVGRVQGMLRTAAVSELGDGASKDLVDEFTAALQSEVYLNQYLHSKDEKVRASATKQLAQVHATQRRLRTEAEVRTLSSALQGKPKDPDEPAFDTAPLRASMSAALADDKELASIESAYPHFVGAVRAGALRADDDFIGLIGTPQTEEAARAALTSVCQLLNSVFARVDFGAEESAAASADAPEKRGVTVDPGSLGIRRDEARSEPPAEFPSADDFI